MLSFSSVEGLTSRSGGYPTDMKVHRNLVVSADFIIFCDLLLFGVERSIEVVYQWLYNDLIDIIIKKFKTQDHSLTRFKRFYLKSSKLLNDLSIQDFI